MGPFPYFLCCEVGLQIRCYAVQNAMFMGQAFCYPLDSSDIYVLQAEKVNPGTE